jgi:hypothetical protein
MDRWGAGGERRERRGRDGGEWVRRRSFRTGLPPVQDRWGARWKKRERAASAFSVENLEIGAGVAVCVFVVELPDALGGLGLAIDPQVADQAVKRLVGRGDG